MDVVLLIVLQIYHARVGLDDLLQLLLREGELLGVLLVLLLEVLDEHLFFAVVELVQINLHIGVVGALGATLFNLVRDGFDGT